MKLTVVVGNPRPASRTRRIAEALAAQLVQSYDLELVPTLDLAEHASRLFAWPDAALDDLGAAVARSDVLVVASPTYKASYTGLLKAFLDRFGHRPFVGVTAIAVMTAESPTHAMAVDHTLRPLLVELGASLPTAGLCFLMSQIDQLDDVVAEWTATNVTPLALFGSNGKGRIQ